MGVIETLLTELKRMLRHPMATDASSLAASQYVAAGLGFITTVVAARVLGAGSYGVAALAMTYPALVWSFVGIKTVSVTTRYIASFRSSGAIPQLADSLKLQHGSAGSKAGDVSCCDRHGLDPHERPHKGRVSHRERCDAITAGAEHARRHHGCDE